MNCYCQKLILLCATALLFFSSPAQYTKANDDPDADYKLAKELYLKEQFSLAYPLFKSLYEERNNSSIPVTMQEESKYYSIICALELKDQTAEKAAREFINLEHNAPLVQMMSYNLGEYYYKKQDFLNANTYYEQAGFDNLSNEEIANMKFHQAYGYFTMQKFSDAKPLFDDIRQITNDPNYYDANYYYGFILLSEKKYKEALSSFQIVEGKQGYQKIVPYYITEIYYFTGQRDRALDYGERVLQQGNQFYDLQLRQLIGHIYFEKKNFEKALPLLEQYVSKTEKVSREDLYELSYCYYNAKEYKKAAEGFKELGGKQDTLAQNSMYMLADSYLQLENKPGARNAFLFCALNNSNEEQKQVSKFNYGKLSYELGYFDVALNELREFAATYPKSEYAGEAKELLVGVLAKTNNYKEALELMNSTGKTESVKRIYPQILYGRATELINDQQLVQANDLLNEIYSVEYNELQIPYANFWKGELSFRTNQYDSAVYYLLNYLRSPVNYGEVNPTNAHYTLGHSFLRQEAYQEALKAFEQITTTISPNSSPIEQDAYLKAADCYFMEKRLGKALEMYEKVISYTLPQTDYALYQKAMIAGASNQYSQKITILQSISKRFPSSPFTADAQMEIANTNLASENYDAAITPLNDLLKNKNAEALKPQVYLKLGVANINLKNNNEALNNFKTLIATYPNSPESDEATEYVRNIFVENQRPEEYINFMRQNGKDISYSEEDSLNYVAANIAYNNKDLQNAFNALNSYIKKFPEGRYAIDANYQCATIFANRKEFSDALPYFDAVAQKAPNKYAEASVLQAARINYFELKDYEAAEKYFSQLKNLASSPENKLESMRGLLRCQYKLAQWSEAVVNAQELLEQKGIATDDKMMANMVIAKNYQANNQLDESSEAYKTVVALGKSEYAAEARYRIAEILLTQSRLPEAEKAGFEVINKAGSYDYWITKAYILLGDVYFKQKDYFNAEATLKSVVENATYAELKKEAQQKLDVVVAEKDKNSKVAQE